jgi:hypothetical protein
VLAAEQKKTTLKKVVFLFWLEHLSNESATALLRLGLLSDRPDGLGSEHLMNQNNRGAGFDSGFNCLGYSGRSRLFNEPAANNEGR